MLGYLRYLDNETVYEIPDLELAPEYLLDEKSGVYRIVLGKIPTTEVEQQQYNKVYALIDSKLEGGFIDQLTFWNDNREVKSVMAYVLREKTPYGTFYEIEMDRSNTQFRRIQNDTSGITTPIKDKKVSIKRKTTSKKQPK